MPGKFFVLEGVDGSGKTTQAAKLTQYLIENKYHVLYTKEPTDITQFSKKIREILKNEGLGNKEKLTELFVKDRFYHANKIIRPLLKKGIYVVCDRYYISTLAYQHTQGMDLEYLLKKHEKILKPNITFFIDVSFETQEKRLKKMNREKISFEKHVEFRENLIENYRKICKMLMEKGNKIEIIDGNRNPEKVFNDIVRKIKDII